MSSAATLWTACRVGIAVAAAALIIAAVVALWSSSVVTDYRVSRDVVPGKCVRSKFAEYEYGIIPFYRVEQFARVPLRECSQLSEGESEARVLLGGLVASLALSVAVLGTTAAWIIHFLGWR